MLFKNVIGQADVKLHLVNMVQHDRISHALLFLGKEGCGALPLAIAFAQYIVCEKVNRKVAAPAGPSLFGEETPPPTRSRQCPMPAVNAHPARRVQAHAPGYPFFLPGYSQKIRRQSPEHRLYQRMARVYCQISLRQCIRLAAVYWRRKQTGKYHSP